VPAHDPATNVPAPRSLEVLRATIDALDREILQLFAYRNGLVAEIAAFKRTHHLPIRDFPREKQMIADRRRHAQELGISPELVESMYRLVLWASRDRQAALRAEVPQNLTPRTVAIVGGAGAMGRRLATFFAELGHAVLIADVDTPLKPVEAAAAADVVVISVPIDVTAAVIHEIGPHVRPEGLLMDVTSIKSVPVRAMLESSSASVVGTHPLFGPAAHSLQGQRVVLTRGRGEEWFDWVRAALHARGMITIETSPEEHDRMMAIVQVLGHYSTEVMGRTLAKLGASIDQTLEYTSPIYAIELLLTARHFAQSPDLYAAIQMRNPSSREVMSAFLKAAQELREICEARNREAFRGVYADVRKMFGAFLERGLEQSEFLIDRVVERA
jgi:chorismate mutase/prephenate dehydrogenase